MSLSGTRNYIAFVCTVFFLLLNPVCKGSVKRHINWEIIKLLVSIIEELSETDSPGFLIHEGNFFSICLSYFCTVFS
jgi:hypothetical protein